MQSLDHQQGAPPMSKQQIIEQIRQMNRSAPENLLVQFDQDALENYLKRLSMAQAGRGRASRWVRNTSSPAVVTREY
jgi:hypothetical protein